MNANPGLPDGMKKTPALLTKEQASLAGRYLKARERSARLADKAAADFGAGRRRSTTNAANWAIAAEERDRLEGEVMKAGVSRDLLQQIEDVGSVRPFS